MKKLIIDELKIRKNANDGVTLYAKVKRDDMEDFELCYDYSVNDSKFIDSEFADPFLVSLLPYAMEYGYDIKVSNPISNVLYEKLRNEFIPVLSKYISYFKDINIEFPCLIEKKIEKNYAVATGCSCGVDSLHTIFSTDKNTMKENANLPLTHLVIVNSGACSWKGGEESRKWFNIEIERGKKVADELGLSLIYVNTNLMEFYGVNHAHSGFMRISGIILGMDKLIKCYYYASSYELSDFRIIDDEDAYYLYLITNSITDNNLNFKIIGLYEDRFSKVNVIQDYYIAKKYINVCWNGGYNCGKCEKCLRTIGAFYTLDKLKYFSDILNSKWFESHKIKGVGRMIAFGRKHKQQYTFLPTLSQKHYFIYFWALIYCYLYIMPFNLIKIIAKKILRRK